MTGNILHCLKQGYQMRWMINNEERSLLIYPPGQQPELLEKAEKVLPVPKLVSDLQLTLSDVFTYSKL